MTEIVFIDADGTRTEVDARNGESLMTTAVDAGVDSIQADCGGTCTCATCHCYVDQAWVERVGLPTESENELLEMTEADRQEGSRLSCQIIISDELDGLIVRVPEIQ